MHDLVPIGRFSTMTRLSIPALRHYAEIGLLVPAEVDARTGYRYYRLGQANLAEAIRTLRSIDVPLDEIAAILGDADPVLVAKHLGAHRERLEARLADQQRKLAYLHRLIDQEESLMPYEITTVETPPVLAASLRLRTDLASIGADLGAAMGRTFGAIGGAAAGAPYVVYHDVIDVDTDGDIEVCIPVRAGTTSTDDGVEVGSTAGALVARTVHQGAYDQIAPAYHALTTWIHEHGHAVAGPPREIYLDDPTTTAPDEVRTEVQWPIA